MSDPGAGNVVNAGALNSVTIQVCSSEDMDKDEKKSSYTVMLGFLCEDEYKPCGIFSHVVKLTKETYAPTNHNINKPELVIVSQQVI